MKVSQSGNQNIHSIYQNQVERPQEGGRSGNHAGIDRTDAVELSSHAQMMQQAARAVEREDPARVQRIAELQEQVQNDTYQVPHQELAQRLLSGLI